MVDFCEENIDKSFQRYSVLMGYDKFVYDKLDIIMLIAQIDDSFKNKNVDFVVNRIKKKQKSKKILIDHDVHYYLKKVSVDTFSNNICSIQLENVKAKQKKFHLTSLSKEDDSENNIFTLFKDDTDYVLLFDKEFTKTEKNIKFFVVLEQYDGGIEIRFDYMNWEYDDLFIIEH